MNSHEKLLNAFNEPLLEIDPAGKVIFATPAVEEWTARSGQYSFASTLDKAVRKRFEQAFTRVIEGKTLRTHVELTMLRKKEWVPVGLALSAIAGDEGKVAAVACWLHDLTLPRALEAAANVQGAHLFDLVENVTHACVIESDEGNVEMVNAAFCDLFKLKAAPQSLVGTACTKLFDEAANQVEKKMAPVYFELDSEEAAELEFPLLSGEIILQRTRPVLGEAGIAGRLHLFHAKIGDQRHDENNHSASHVAELQLIERIAHELSATIDQAHGAIDRAEQLDLPEAIIKRFRGVKAAASAAFGSIATLIDFSRMDSAEVTLHTKDFSLRPAVASMFEAMLDNDSQQQVSLSLKIEQDVADELLGDGPNLMRAIQNLLECGIAAHAAGGSASLTIAPEYSTKEITHLEFTVQHCPPEGERQIVFTPNCMMQLAIAKQIIKSMGGKLDVRENKVGTQYQFTLPFVWKKTNRIVPRPDFITLTGMPVLVVSADVEERKQLTHLMRTWRMLPHEADNGSMAMYLLSRLQREQKPIPLLIISDQLSGQDSFLLAFRVKHHAELSNTMVMMLAKLGKPGDAIACGENSIGAYLRQPVIDYHVNEAIALLMGVIERGAAEEEKLITRHSLRERSAGNVLIIDAQREQSAAAAKIMRKNDYRVVSVETAQEAYESLKQDIFDLIVVEPTTPGFARNKSIVGLLRNHVQKNAEVIPILLAGSEKLSSAKEYTGQVLRPYDYKNVMTEIRRVHSVN